MTTKLNISPAVVPWEPADPKGENTGKYVQMPALFCATASRWQPILGPAIDEMTSDPRTLDLLSALVVFAEPPVVVEVGTYRGWGTAILAETLRFNHIKGHVWSCDPVDHGVSQLLATAELSDHVTLVHGNFETLLATLNRKMDFCYIDASDHDEAGLRLRYTQLALDHMNPWGIVVVDDSAGDWEGSAILQKMANLYLPMNRGLTVLVK